MLAKQELDLAPRFAADLAHRQPDQQRGPSRATITMRSVWRRRGLVVVLTAAALVPAILYVRLAKPLYTGTATLLVRRTGDGNTDSGRAAAPTLTAEELAAQEQVITSQPVLAAALATPGVRDCDPLRNHHDLIEFLKGSLRVNTDGGGVMVVSIDSAIPDDATTIVAAVTQSYAHFYSALRRNGNSDALTALRTEKASRQGELAAKSADLLHYGEQHHVGAGEDPSVLGAAELTSLSDALNDAHLATVEAKSASDNLTRELADDPKRAQSLKWFEESSPASGRVKEDDEELLRRELLSLKATQLQLQQKLMPGNPALVKVQQGIDDLMVEHDAAIQRHALTTQQHEADLQKAYDDAQKRILDRSAEQAEYARRSIDVTLLQKTVDQLDHRIAGMDVADNSGTPDVQFLDPAKASYQPTSPDRQRDLSLAGASGLLISCLLACWLERGRLLSISPEQAGFNMPVLAELPALPTDFGPMAGGQRTLLTGGPALEEIFHRLGSIVEGGTSRGRAAIVLVTSPSRGDGKSTFISNFAVSLAMTHKRVLLVDADLRSAAQSKIFGIGNLTGLATLLEAEVSIPITAIHHTGIPSLDVIPSGPLTRNPAELLNSQRFIDLLGDLAERYDYVLLDSPPAVTFSDARIISASCDLTMLVVGTHQPNRRLFQIAVDGLTTVGANLCGLVLNSGKSEQRSEAILNGTMMGATGKSKKSAAPEPIEVAATRRLAGAVVTLARAMDLVRAAPTNSRVFRQLPGDGKRNGSGCWNIQRTRN